MPFLLKSRKPESPIFFLIHLFHCIERLLVKAACQIPAAKQCVPGRFQIL
jgi:hypothetical protein